MATIESGGTVRQVKPPVPVPSCSHAPQPLSPDKYGNIINIAVGLKERRTTFAIHEGLLRHHSSYFAAALKQLWRDSDTLELPEDEVDTFRIFFHWTYSGKLYTSLGPKGEIPITNPRLCQLYVFGDMRGVPELCNTVIEVIFQKSIQDHNIQVWMIERFYEHTRETAPIRKFLVDQFVEKASCGTALNRIAAIVPQQFLLDILTKMGREAVGLGRGLGVAPADYARTKAAQICGSYHDHNCPEPEN